MGGGFGRFSVINVRAVGLFRCCLLFLYKFQATYIQHGYWVTENRERIRRATHNLCVAEYMRFVGKMIGRYTKVCAMLDAASAVDITERCMGKERFRMRTIGYETIGSSTP
jgi:hypothetical protein